MLGCFTALFVASTCSGAAASKPRTLLAAQSGCESAAVASYSMTYDSNRRRVMIFGGKTTGGAASAATWGWDGHTWECIAPAIPTGPSAREASMLAYDARRRVLVLYGGRVGRQMLRDTWELSASGWQRKNDAGPTPAPHGVLAYDSVSAGVLLYNSVGENVGTRATWRWDGAAWTKLAEGPNEQFPNAMFSSRAGQPALLITAQATGAPDAFNPPIYQWRDGRWDLITVTGDIPIFSPQAPAARTASGALLYAGFESSGAVTTFILDGTVWRRYSGESPPRRRNAQMVFDPARSVVVLHAGYDGTHVLTDTWEWNGIRWKKVH